MRAIDPPTLRPQIVQNINGIFTTEKLLMRVWGTKNETKQKSQICTPIFCCKRDSNANQKWAAAEHSTTPPTWAHLPSTTSHVSFGDKTALFLWKAKIKTALTNVTKSSTETKSETNVFLPKYVRCPTNVYKSNPPPCPCGTNVECSNALSIVRRYLTV